MSNAVSASGESDAAPENDLVAGLRAGDINSFRQAVIQFSPMMLATARRLIGPAEAEDLVQEAWLAAYRQIDGFEGRSRLSTWLCRIVSNRAISTLRKRREVQSLDALAADGALDRLFDNTGHWEKSSGLWDPGTPEELLGARELQSCIDRHLDKMPENQRQVVLLRDTHEKSFDDICNALQLSASNVRVLLHRGRLRLLAMVNNFQETGTC